MSDLPLETLELMESVMKQLAAPAAICSSDGGFKRVGGLRDLGDVLESLQQCVEDEGEEWQAGDDEVLGLLEATMPAPEEPATVASGDTDALEHTVSSVPGPQWPQPGQVDDETYLQEIGPESTYPVVSEEKEAELSEEALRTIESRREYYRSQASAPDFRS